MGLFTVKESKELVVFAAKLVSSCEKAASDGIQLADSLKLIDPLMAAPAALLGIDKVIPEFSDLDPVEAEELKGAIAEALDLSNDVVEAVAEEVLGVALQLAAAIAAMKAAKAVVAPSAPAETGV